MIHSLFLINSSGDIFLEKHWKSVVSRSVCDYFFEAQERASEAENVPPVIPTPHHYLLSVYRHKIFFVAVIQTEVPPLFVIEFLHRVVDTFQVGTYILLIWGTFTQYSFYTVQFSGIHTSQGCTIKRGHNMYMQLTFACKRIGTLVKGPELAAAFL